LVWLALSVLGHGRRKGQCAKYANLGIEKEMKAASPFMPKGNRLYLAKRRKDMRKQ